MLKPPARELPLLREQQSRHTDKERAKLARKRERAIAKAKELEKRLREAARARQADVEYRISFSLNGITDSNTNTAAWGFEYHDTIPGTWTSQ